MLYTIPCKPKHGVILYHLFIHTAVIIAEQYHNISVRVFSPFSIISFPNLPCVDNDGTTGKIIDNKSVQNLEFQSIRTKLYMWRTRSYNLVIFLAAKLFLFCDFQICAKIGGCPLNLEKFRKKYVFAIFKNSNFLFGQLSSVYSLIIYYLHPLVKSELFR